MTAGLVVSGLEINWLDSNGSCRFAERRKKKAMAKFLQVDIKILNT